MNKNKPLEMLSRVFEKPHKSTNDLEYVLKYLSHFDDLRDSMKKLTWNQKILVASRLKFREILRGNFLFRKGETANDVFIVLSGTLGLYDSYSDEKQAYEALMGEGRVLGERAVYKKKPHILSCKVIKKAFVLSLDSRTFKEYIMEEFLAVLREKQDFLSVYIPDAGTYSKTHLQRIAYSLRLRYYHKGDTVSKQGEFSESVLAIAEGSCKVVREDLFGKRVVSYLEKGSLLCEETALYNQPCKYTLEVTSKVLKVFSMRNQLFEKLLKSSSVDLLKEMLKTREKKRINCSVTALPKLNSKSYSMASPVANKKLNNSLVRRQLSLTSLDLGKKRIKLKKILQKASRNSKNYI